MTDASREIDVEGLRAELAEIRRWQRRMEQSYPLPPAPVVDSIPDSMPVITFQITNPIDGSWIRFFNEGCSHNEIAAARPGTGRQREGGEADLDWRTTFVHV